jgi:hypothetical protein
MMTHTHFSKDQLIILHNNLAARYGKKPIKIGSRISFDELADRIEAVQHPSVRRTPPAARRGWLLRMMQAFGGEWK